MSSIADVCWQQGLCWVGVVWYLRYVALILAMTIIIMIEILLRGGQKLSIANLWGATIQVGALAHQLINSKGGRGGALPSR